MRIQASHLTAGQVILVNYVWVRLVKREKWSISKYMLYLEDIGNGLPFDPVARQQVRTVLVSATVPVEVQD